MLTARMVALRRRTAKEIIMAEENPDNNAVELATELTIAWLGNPNTRISAEEVPAFLGKMHETVSGLLGSGIQPVVPAEPVGDFTPAVTVRKSLASKDHIISMIDGKPYKTLRRHLATHGLTPAEYRDRYGLKPDYPMVAENYSESRRAMAKKIGLGRKPGARKSVEAPVAPTRRRKAETATGE
jgi:predicted transcriptional regulator